MVIEHCQCRSRLLRSQHFIPPLILNVNFTKQKLKISYPQDSNWGLPGWEHAVIATDWKPAEWESP